MGSPRVQESPSEPPPQVFVETARLELRPSTLAIARAALQGSGAVEALLARSVPATWPPSELREALALDAQHLVNDHGYLGWGVWLVLRRNGGPLVGSAGFKGPPGRAGTIEIGYGIEPSSRRRGFATEAVAALVDWAWHRAVRRIVAECHPDNHASIAVLERVGMHRTRPRAGMLWWELDSPW
jgi:ribosomal-protein-alanine N-acetyltransferase